MTHLATLILASVALGYVLGALHWRAIADKAIAELERAVSTLGESVSALHDLESYQLRARAVLAALAERLDSWGSREAAEVVRAAARQIEAEEEP